MINPKKKKRPYLDYDLEGYIKGQQTARTDATSNLQATTLRLVAENNTSEKVLLRRVANERRKTLEAYEKGKRDYEKQLQAAKILEDIESRPWWNPTTVLRNAKDIPIFGAAPTATEWAYGLMNKAVGNDAAGDYYMLDADKSATGQAIALAAIPAHTNPYTAAMYDTALLAPWAKELDAQGKFYHPETLTGEEAAMLGLSVLPFGLKYKPLLSYAKAAAEDAALQSSIPWVRDNARGLYLSRAINLAADLGVLAPIKVNRTVERDGTIRMSLPSHTSEQPRLFVIDPLGNNKYYIHMRTWDGKKIPANLSNAEKNSLFEAVYNELPEGAEILFPQSSSEYLGTRGTVAGLQRLSRDPRFEPGSPGTLLYWDDKTKSVKTYNGTSFIKKPLLSATLYVIENSEPVNIPTINWQQSRKPRGYVINDDGTVTFDDGIERTTRETAEEASKEINKAAESLVDSPYQNMDISKFPEAKYKYNPRTGEFDIEAPLQTWVDEGEPLVQKYYESPEEYNRMIASGASPEDATLVTTVRALNAENRLPSELVDLGDDIFGQAENINGQARIDYNNRTNSRASNTFLDTLLSTIFHELGGHGSSLNVGYGTQTIPEHMVPILKKIYKHNEALRPKLKPVYLAIKDGDYETAKRLAETENGILKGTNGEINFKEIKDLIDYMEDVQEYSARALGTNMGRHYGVKNNWNTDLLYKYFTKETVDNLLKNVWQVGLPLVGGGTLLYNALDNNQLIQVQKKGRKILPPWH